MVYSLRCNSPSDESNKIFRKFDSVQRATFEGILGVLRYSWKGILGFMVFLEGMLGPKRCLTTKLQEYLQRLHAEPNQIFERFYLIRPKENCIAKSRPFWEQQGKNAKYQEHIKDRLHMLNCLVVPLIF